VNQEASYLAEPNPLSIPYGWVITLTATNQQLSFNLYGDSGSNYVLQASPDLDSTRVIMGKGQAFRKRTRCVSGSF
jgi:hypothetical protein